MPNYTPRRCLFRRVLECLFDFGGFVLGILEQYENAHAAFLTGKVMSDDNETLLNHLSGLANQNNINEGTQHRDIIRGITINHLLLQHHIDNLNKQNSRTQKLVVALTVASLIGTAVQVWYANKADKIPEVKTQTIAVSQQQPETKLASPSPVKPQSSNSVKVRSP